MDKAIVTTFLLIAGIVTAILVFNTVYPAVIRSGDAITMMERRIEDRLKSQVEIIHATGKSTDTDVSVWVKNIGSSRISVVERCDLFFGPEGNFTRIPYGSGGPPYWDYTLENDTRWNPTATLKITIHHSPGYPSAGRNFVKVIALNGVSDEYFFNVE